VPRGNVEDHDVGHYNSAAPNGRTDLEPILYEDLQLGGVWSTRGRTLTEADFSAYAGVAGDYGLHVDAEAAASSYFGARVAPAGLLVGVAIGLGSMDVPGAAGVALVGTSWRFVKPAPIGMTVHARWRLQRKRDVENPRWGLCTWDVVLLAGEDAVADGEVSFLVARREAAPVAPARPRRGRRRRKTPEVPILPPPEANLPPSGQAIPEPAPEDVPPPKTRRRRRSTASARPAAETPAPAPGDVVPPSETPPGRRRRRRRRNGNGGGSSTGGQAPEPAKEAVSTREPSAVEKVLERLTGRRLGS
jgi:acyl dehydratase